MSDDGPGDRESVVHLKAGATWSAHVAGGVACALVTSTYWVVVMVTSPYGFVVLPYFLVAVVLVGAIAAVPCRLVLVAAARRARDYARPVAWTATTAGVIATSVVLGGGVLMVSDVGNPLDPAAFVTAAQAGMLAAVTAAAAARLSLTREPDEL